MTKNTKHKSAPVVARTEEKHSCKSGGECNCHKGGHGCKTFVKSTVTLFSALMISASIFASAHMLGGFKAAPATPASRDADIRNFIQKNPKFIADTMNEYYKSLQQKKDAEPRTPQVADKKLVDEILADKTNYSLGNPNGKFVIIEFFDYQCGWCKRTNEGISKAIAEGKAPNVRWILIDTPIFGEKSQLISRYVLAAGKQGKFGEMHDAVSKLKGAIDETALINAAKELKLNTQKLTADAKGDEISKKLEANKKYTEALNIRGVPMLIVDGKINPGALFGEKLDEAIKQSNEKK